MDHSPLFSVVTCEKGRGRRGKGRRKELEEWDENPHVPNKVWNTKGQFPRIFLEKSQDFLGSISYNCAKLSLEYHRIPKILLGI